MASLQDPRPAVLVVDDHELTRTLLAEALAQRLDPLAVASLSSRQVRADEVAGARLAILRAEPGQAAALAARLTVLGAPSPGSADEAVAPRLLLLCEEDAAQTARAAFAAGFQGVISSDASLELLVAAIRLLLAGGAYFPQLVSACPPGSRSDDEAEPIRMALAERCAATPASAETGESLGGSLGARTSLLDVPLDVGVFGEVAGLTARERLVLAEMCRGHPNKVIARVLNISENTAKMHVRRILAKLRVRNRTEAAVLINSRQQ